jgi:hypothetical protein
VRTSIEVGGATVSVPAGWYDVTDQVDAEDKPYTLTRPDGVGALQFTVGLYRRGKQPQLSSADLLENVEGFGRSQGFSEPFDQTTEDSTLTLAAASFHSRDDFIRVWHVTDGRNLATITYVSEFGAEGSELGDCEEIVRSISFADARIRL